MCGLESQSGALCNMGYLSETYRELKSCEISFAHRLFHIWSIVLKLKLHCIAVILTGSVQNTKKNIWKSKGMLWTNEILRDLSLRWVSDVYPPTLHSPIEARFLSILCHASQTMCDWDLCLWGVFSITTAVGYEVLRNFWEISKVNITYINFTYINNRTAIFIHALHTPMSSRCIPTCNSIS